MYIKKIISKYKEVISYGIFGILTTAVNYITYFIFTREFNANYLVSNIVAWLFSVMFAYITNKIWVFHSNTKNIIDIVKEVSLFIGARIFSGIMDTLLLFLLYDYFGINDFVVKIFNGVLVVIINYFFSKLIIFRRKKV